jgi:hypothetical protein
LEYGIEQSAWREGLNRISKTWRQAAGKRRFQVSVFSVGGGQKTARQIEQETLKKRISNID